MSLTIQQQAVVDAAVAGKSLMVSAVAGSGKSHTLLKAITALPEEKSVLYLVYNKANQVEFVEKLSSTYVPCQYKVKTIHSLAYTTHARKVMLQRPQGAYKNVLGTAKEIENAFRIQPFGAITPRQIAAVVLGSVNAFECSYYNSPSVNNSLFAAMVAKSTLPKSQLAKLKEIVLVMVKNLWKMRLNRTAVATHNTYLKLYAMSKPTLEYDVVMLDEAQDAVGPVKSIIDANPQVQWLLVGDPNQAIYQFNHCINLFQYYDFEAMPLSKSFRYGTNLAKASDQWLGDNNITSDSSGLDRDTTILPLSELDLSIEHTRVFRLNASMIHGLVMYAKVGIKASIGRSLTNSLIRQIEELAYFRDGDMKKVRNPALLAFDSFESYAESKADDDDRDWVFEVVIDNNEKGMINLLEQMLEQEDEATATFVTVHRSKGLEYDTVVVDHDVFQPMKGNKPMPISRINLGYVAMTRAVNTIYM